MGEEDDHQPAMNLRTSVLCEELDGALGRWVIRCGGLPGADDSPLVFIASKYKDNWKVDTERPKPRAATLLLYWETQIGNYLIFKVLKWHLYN